MVVINRITSFIISVCCFLSIPSRAQLKWQNVDSLYQPLPSSMHVYKTTDSLDGKPNIAFYVEVNLKNKKLEFTADTTYQRRLTPSKFYEKNDKPLLVVNCTFFSFATNQNLSLVIKNKKVVGYNIHTVNGRGKDTLTYKHPFGSAIGIDKNRNADIAWTYTDSSLKSAYAAQTAKTPLTDSLTTFNLDSAQFYASAIAQLNNSSRNVKFTRDGNLPPALKVWKMETAVGGGPVLLQNGEINIANNKELKFAGKAIDDKHPRTAMGYTKDNKLVILLVQGRFPGIAEGATLTQEAQLLKDIGCFEALNLDGGGSSCLLVNGRETIKPSDKEGQRPVPAVFLIKAND